METSSLSLLTDLLQEDFYYGKERSIKLIIQTDDKTCSTEWVHNELSTDELCEAFKGLLVAYGYQEDSVLRGMEDIVESTERE